MRKTKVIRILERRQKWLKRRVVTASKGRRDYDLAEISALEVALSVLRTQRTAEATAPFPTLALPARTGASQETVQEN